MLKKDKKGFTLVEILIALVILSMGIAMLITMFTVGMDGVVANQARTQATNLAQDLMDEILGKNFPHDGKEANRSLYTDVSDYSDWGPYSPPKSYSETGLTQYASFSRSADVYYVSTSDLDTEVVDATDLKAISVWISHSDINDVVLKCLKTPSVYQ